MKWILILSIYFSINSFASEKKEFDFANLKDVLKNDMLDGVGVQAKLRKEKKENLKKNKILLESRFPDKAVFWPYMIELWLVKNNQDLKWSFEHPDIGVSESFSKFLTKLGHLEVEFEVLIVDSYKIFHRALPGQDGKILFVLSYPFVKAMDLSRKEISYLLLFEYLRSRRISFVEKVAKLNPKLDELYGKSFVGMNIKDLLVPVSSSISKIIYNSRLDFKQQFGLIKEMKSNLTTKDDLNAYKDLMKKIDSYVESNPDKMDYIKQTVAPQMVLKWLGKDK